MTLDHITHETCAAPRNTIIVLHGLGADGHDFEPICAELDLAAVGGARFVLPHAPQRPVTINGGMRMRAWYDILGTQLERREDEGGLRESQALIGALIEAEIARGTPAGRIVLMGFSQGCAMTLLTGLRFGRRLAGLVGLSGYLPLLAQTEAEANAANAATPVFLAHGRHDPIVPLARGQAARAELERLGHAVQWQDYAMEHSVCMEEIEALNDWLLRTLAA